MASSTIGIQGSFCPPISISLSVVSELWDQSVEVVEASSSESIVWPDSLSCILHGQYSFLCWRRLKLRLNTFQQNWHLISLARTEEKCLVVQNCTFYKQRSKLWARAYMLQKSRRGTQSPVVRQIVSRESHYIKTSPYAASPTFLTLRFWWVHIYILFSFVCRRFFTLNRSN